MNGFEVKLGYQGHFSWEMGRGGDSGDNQGGGNIENELKEVVSGQNWGDPCRIESGDCPVNSSSVRPWDVKKSLE
jgi:hypothetical protein